MSLALNTVVCNEESRISQLLDHCSEYCDELIVVVDEASTDATWTIAMEYGATVVTGPHSEFCEPLRPLAADHTLSDWIVVLDADEIVNPERLGDLLSLDRARYKTAVLPRRNLVGGLTVGSGLDPHLRYFAKGHVTYGLQPHNYIRANDPTTVFAPSSPGWILHLKTFDEHDQDVIRELRVRREVRDSNVIRR